MTDDAKAAVEWLRKYTKAQRDGLAVVMKLPADYAEYILAHLDGEPARIAAAVAAAREEQREACTQYLRDYARDLDEEVRYNSRATRAYFEQVVATGEAADRCRYAPLDATPLADRIKALEADRARLEEAEEGALKLVAKEHHGRITAEAEAERLRRLLDEHVETDCRAASERDELEKQCWDESQRADRAEAERDEAVTALREYVEADEACAALLDLALELRGAS